MANTPVANQYTCNTSTGVYTFNTANGTAVNISYTWNSAASGKTISITNQLLGNAPTFQAVFTSTYNGQQMTFKLNQCMSSKLSFATKLEDWMIPEFDFDIFADASNTIGSVSLDN